MPRNNLEDIRQAIDRIRRNRYYEAITDAEQKSDTDFTTPDAPARGSADWTAPSAKRLRTNRSLYDELDTNDDVAPPQADQSTGTSTNKLAGRSTGDPAPTQGINFTKIEDHAPEGQLLTNTRTANLKWEGYCSVNRICRTLTSGTGLNAFDLILNHPYQPLLATCVNPTTSSGGICVYRAKNTAAGVPSTSNTVNVRTRGELFPRQLICTSSVAGATDLYDKFTVGLVQHQRCTWSEWYKKLYEYYHVLETSYEVVVEHTSNTANHREPVLIGVHEESYVQSNTSDIWPYQMTYPNDGTPESQNRTKSMTVDQAKRFKGIKWYKLENRLAGTLQPWRVTITGTWKPGSIEGSVKNLDDIKQWYPTGLPPDPSWTELHGFWFFMGNDGFGTGMPATGQSTGDLNGSYPAVNCHIKLNYKVQFKGLNQKLHFAAEPAIDADVVALRFGRDNVQFPYPIEAHRIEPLDP